MTKITDTAAAILQFELAAIRHAKSTEHGDYKTANKNYTMINVAVHHLRENNAIYEMEQLLSHEDISVRLAASSFFLAHDETKAILVLEDIVRLEIPHKSFEAKMVLDEYRKGNLKL